MITSSLLLILLLVIAFYTAVPIFKTQLVRGVSLSSIVVITYVGILALAVFWVICMKWNISVYSLIILPIIGFVTNFKVKKKAKPKFSHSIAYVSIFIILNLNLIIQGVRMGSGNYAQEFYNVDSAAYLSLLQGFLKSNTYPVMNLEVLEAKFNYHYGSIALAAIFSKFAGFKPHFSLFLIVPLFSKLTIYTILLSICKRILPNKSFFTYLSCVSLIILFINFQINTLRPIVLYHLIFKVPYFGKGYSILSSLVAISIALFVLDILLGDKVEYKRKWLLLVLISILPFYKIPYYPIVLGLTILTLTYNYFKTKARWILWFIPAITLTSLFVMFYLAYPINMSNLTTRGTNKIFFTFSIKSIFQFLIEHSIFIVPFFFIFFQKKRKFSNTELIIVTTFFVSFVGCNLILLDNPDYMQLYELVPILLPTLILPLLISLDLRGSIFFKIARMLYLIIPAATVFVSYSIYTIMLFTNKTQTHEYTCNIDIADALKIIPVNTSLIVTNDLRYPADNYARNNKQFQITALFGHQALGVSSYFITKNSENYYLNSLEIAKDLQKEFWSDSTLRKMIKYKVTHVLIHKDYAYCKNIPLKKNFDSGKYAVYEVNNLKFKQ